MDILVVSFYSAFLCQEYGSDGLEGAWAARYLALLISLIGLPKDGDERLFSRIYKACNNNTIWKEGVAAKLMNGYDCKFVHPTIATSSHHPQTGEMSESTPSAVSTRSAPSASH
jgi:hypothetical protein